MTAEEWRRVESAPQYEVSNLGRVRSWISNRRWAPDGPPHLIHIYIDRAGYPLVGMTRDGKRRWVRVHRVVTRAFYGPCPEGLEVRHLDGNPENNALTNLAYGTKSENRYDTVRHGNDKQASKTECVNGHPFDEANTRIRPNGHRACRACHVVDAVKHRRKKSLERAS